MGRVMIGAKRFDAMRILVSDKEIILEDKGKKQEISLMNKDGTIKKMRIEFSSANIRTIKTQIPIVVFGKVRDIATIEDIEVNGSIKETKSKVEMVEGLEIETFEKERKRKRDKGARVERSPILVKVSGAIDFVDLGEIMGESDIICHISGDIGNIISQNLVKCKGDIEKAYAGGVIRLMGILENEGR